MEENKTTLEVLRDMFARYHEQSQADLEDLRQQLTDALQNDRDNRASTSKLREGMEASLRDLRAGLDECASRQELRDLIERLTAIESNHSNIDYRCTPLKMHGIESHKSALGKKEWTIIISAVITGLTSLVIQVIKALMDT